MHPPVIATVAKASSSAIVASVDLVEVAARIALAVFAVAPRTGGGDRPSDGEQRRRDGDLLALASNAAAAGAMAVGRASSRCEDVDLGDHRGDQPSSGERRRCIIGVSNIQLR